MNKILEALSTLLDNSAAVVEAVKHAPSKVVAKSKVKKISKLQQVTLDKDGAYHERNQLVSLLSKLYPSGIKKTPIEGWNPEWLNCVYIDLPTGQASWHIHEKELPMFRHLKPYKKEWDGHTTEEKYKRVAAVKKRF